MTQPFPCVTVTRPHYDEAINDDRVGITNALQSKLRAERVILSNLEIYTLALYTEETSQEWYSQMLRMIHLPTFANLHGEIAFIFASYPS